MKFDRLIIHGKLFRLDSVNRIIFDEEDLGNIIPYDDVASGGDLRFVYDRQMGCRAKVDFKSVQDNDPRYLKVDIPKWMTELSYKPLLGHQYTGFRVLDPKYYDRISGELPEIDLVDEPYRILVNDNALARVSDGSALSMHGMIEFKEQGDSLRGAYFNMLNRQFVKLDPGMLEFPKHVVYITVPDNYTLDPVGMALKEGKVPYAYLGEYSMTRYRADIRHLENSPAMGILRRNTKKQDLQAVQKEEKGKGKRMPKRKL